MLGIIIPAHNEADPIKARILAAQWDVLGIDDWTGHSDPVRKDFLDTYCDTDGHRHIHEGKSRCFSLKKEDLKKAGPLNTRSSSDHPHS